MKHDWRGVQIAGYLHDIGVEVSLDVPDFHREGGSLLC